MDRVYGLDFPIKSFAIANDFVININKVCYALGQQLRPFCLYATDKQKEYKVIDFSVFDGITGSDKKLIDEVVEYRRGIFESFGIHVDINDEDKVKLLFFDYLMSISICYVEVPRYTTRDGMSMQSYDKFFCTKNPSIMATWMGDTPNVMQAKYSPRIQARQVEFNANELRFVKLNHSSKGNSITVPRNATNVSKIKCIPLFMLYAFTEGAKTVMSNNIVEFTFLKDNGTIREIATTLNQDILMDYYHDTAFVNTMLQGVDINSVEQGGMRLSSHASRGYIKVPELGSSIYDDTGVRSLNIARLLSAKVVSEVDRTFINVDLNSAVQNFKNSIDYVLKNNPDQLINVYREVTGEEPTTTQPPILLREMYEFVDGRSVLLSTTFHRSLHLFLVSHPEWFPLYTGKPAQKVTSSANFGVEQMDF